MGVDVDKVITLLNLIAREEQVQCTVRHSFRGSAMAGAGAFGGGLMGGPPGMLIGGVLGTFMGYFSTRNNYVSIPEAIESLPEYRKQAIANHVNEIVSRLEISDLTQLIAIAAALSTSGSTGSAALLSNPMLRNIFDNSIEYIRNQVEEHNRTSQ